MSETRKYTLELKEPQYEYLTRMAKKYDLPDESKALRCLLNFAMEQSSDGERDIFEEVRCVEC
jgi:hypothetical protein